MKLIIEDDEGRKTVVPIVRDDVEITIGRQEGNTIRLTERNVSRRHAKLIRRAGSVTVEDLSSYNGVKVNGDRISGNCELKQGDLVQIGDYDLAIQAENGELAAPAPARPGPEEPTAPNDLGEEAFGAPETPPPAAKKHDSTAIINPERLRAEHEQARKVVDIPAERAPRLALTTTEHAGREYACIRSEIKIGRGDDNDVAIDHRSLSRNHCKLVLAGGEWKVIDLQSANGIKVNGETYAECALRPGDTLELGHLKFKFLAAGEELPSAAPEDDEKTPLPSPAKSKTPLFIGAGAAALVVLGVAGYLLTRGDDKPAIPPAAELDDPRPAAGKAGKTGATEEEPGQAPEKQAQAAERPAPPSKAEPDPKVAKAFEAGKQLLADGKFEEAEKKLAVAKDSGIAEAEELLGQARSEIEARGHVSAAQKYLAAKDYDSAKFELDAVPADSSFAAKAQELNRQLASAAKKASDDDAAAARKAEERQAAEEKARKDREAAEAREAAKRAAAERMAAAKPAKNSEPKASAGGNQGASDFAQGKSLAAARKYKQAIPYFDKALAEDATLVEAHMYLGLCYASIENITKGAYHYEEFAHGSPSHPKAAEVRKILRQYYSESGAKPRYPLPDD